MPILWDIEDNTCPKFCTSNSVNNTGVLSLANNWLNRNSLHIDTSGETSKNKTIVYKVLDGIKGVKDDDIEKNSDLFIYNTKDLFNIKNVEFVKLDNKDIYIKIFSKIIINSINIYGIRSDYLGLLNYYLKLGYVKEEEIKEKIKIILNINGSRIYNKLNNWIKYINNGKVENLQNYIDNINIQEKYILDYCFRFGFIKKPVQNISLFDYGENIDLLEIYYMKITGKISTEGYTYFDIN